MKSHNFSPKRVVIIAILLLPFSFQNKLYAIDVYCVTGPFNLMANTHTVTTEPTITERLSYDWADYTAEAWVYWSEPLYGIDKVFDVVDPNKIKYVWTIFQNAIIEARMDNFSSIMQYSPFNSHSDSDGCPRSLIWPD